MVLLLLQGYIKAGSQKRILNNGIKSQQHDTDM